VLLGILKAGGGAGAIEPGEPPAAQQAQALAMGAAFRWADGQLLPTGSRRRPAGPARYLKLTSGSTGRPRILAFTDAQLLADGRNVCATMGIRRDDLNFGLIPFGHSYGLGNLVIPLLQQGTTIVVATSALPQAVAADIARSGATVFPAVPAVLRGLAESDIAPAQLRTVRTLISAGAPLDPAVAQAFAARFGRRIHNFYGSSETGGIAYDRTGAATLSGRSVGRPLRGVRLRLAGGGRMVVESAAVHTLGNRRPPGPGGRGRHQPADRGRLNAQGEVVLLGRLGRMLKVAGRRLDPAEVEGALRQVPGVSDAWVTPHPARPDTLAAVVAGRVSAEAARAALRPILAAWKIPRKIVTLPELPLTPRGKPDLRRLGALLGGS
jgi:acyl-coenzyme A synthetase/AMP-(fatty) acid ligase